MVTVTFRGQSGRWPGHIVEMQDTVVTVSFTPSPDAIVGRYRTYVNIITATGVIKSQKNHDYDFYLLFNAWCKSRTRPRWMCKCPAGAHRDASSHR